ncbi:hypothetical protein Agub_g9047 [Astrephomene gubernaculifera]|uniref:Uncharacterized protein n=1 Tax=Astrephomene gubernaculifera TaxID=47775 RepID=A0AAD3DSX6_9CHLO|nr:hypothetical protein Agub_g9047 [Astrephomene gubernaculifera]
MTNEGLVELCFTTMHSTILAALAISTFFALATASNTTLLIGDRNQTAAIHPTCRCKSPVCQPYTRGIVDFTAALRAANSVPKGACIFNPALLRIEQNLYCVFVRVYTASSDERRCVPGRLDRPPFMDAWNGTLANMLAVIRIRRTRQGGDVSVTMVGHRYFHDINYEDGRLFRDPGGRIFLYLAIPFGKYGGARAAVNTAQRVFLTCRNAPTFACAIKLGPPRMLRYDKSIAWEKNWVPWNGTTLMSYSHYGVFGPHSVFNWSSYREPVPHARFVSVANQSFFSTWTATYGKLIQLSGGTPAILEPSGSSFLAMGHVRIHPGCLHPNSIPGLDQLLGDKVRTNCHHFLKLPQNLKKDIPFRSFMYRNADGNTSKHYHVDYGMFFYRFSAEPPYSITHISHGILPPSEGHFGIVFPTGLERMGSDYVVSYGDADQASKLMFLSQGDVDKLLIPLVEMEKRITSFSLCTLPLFVGNSSTPEPELVTV